MIIHSHETNMRIAVNKTEANKISSIIGKPYSRILAEYDFKKYPIDEYEHHKDVFSSLRATSLEISNAMIWKWGHWGKNNYPESHRALISEIQSLWPQFVESEHTDTPKATFDWWKAKFARKTTYITTAYITHLIHHEKQLPIIDQHNFRAMNWLMRQVRANYLHKQKPSNWVDVYNLKEFMTEVLDSMNSKNIGELDRFLMMYGRSHIVRKKPSC